jgi:hypothetical protein
VTARVPWRPPSWTDTPAGRLLFVHELRGCGVPVRVVKPDRRHRGGFAVAVTVTPPDMPACRVHIVFAQGGEVPGVHVDGPIDSPHRYDDGGLCMWYPHDPPGHRWTRRDGARALLGQVVAHLVREEWWRRTGEWIGDETPHGRPADDHRLRAAGGTE